MSMRAKAEQAHLAFGIDILGLIRDFNPLSPVHDSSGIPN
jgi:hypothetical protein